MDNLEKQTKQLATEIASALEKLKITDLELELKTLRKTAEEPEFWSNNQAAQVNVKKQSSLEGRIKPWRALERDAKDLSELIKLKDVSLEAELAEKYSVLSTEYSSLKNELKLSGPYDGHDALLSLHAGAGGTDAQDWAQMLLRMYVRWAERHNMKLTMIDESSGEEAGIKSATFEISGSFAYGKIKSENGVHRLVRLSPFNSDNLRQTSFAKVEVMPKIDTPETIEIDEKDLKIDVYRSGGKGGQSVNTTDSAVRITHIPTGLVVAIQNERSQLQNKETAMTILRSRLAQLQLDQHQNNLRELKGPNEQAAWGNQIRSYVLHPYKQVKDLRTGQESTDTDAVLNGDLDAFIDAYLEYTSLRNEDK